MWCFRYCPVFPFDVINLLVRTLSDSRAETQNGFGKDSNLLEGYGTILCDWKTDRTAKLEGQSCSGASGVAGWEWAGPLLVSTQPCSRHSAFCHETHILQFPFLEQDWLSAQFSFENCREILRFPAWDRCPRTGGGRYSRRGWGEQTKAMSLTGLVRSWERCICLLHHNAVLDTKDKPSLLPKWTSPQVSCLYLPV